jgi:hypothetical protein
MTLLAVCYAVVLAVAWNRCWPDLRWLILLNVHPLLPNPSSLPENKLQRRLDHNGVGKRLFRVWWICTLVLGYCHAYAAEKEALTAMRDAARSQQPPFHCDNLNTNWRDVGWAEAAQLTLYPTSAEQSCASYLERTRASVWPNPMVVAVDVCVLIPARGMHRVAAAFGVAINAFAATLQSWFLQAYVMTFAPCIICFLIVFRAYLWCWVHTPVRWLASRLQSRPPKNDEHAHVL